MSINQNKKDELQKTRRNSMFGPGSRKWKAKKHIRKIDSYQKIPYENGEAVERLIEAFNEESRAAESIPIQDHRDCPPRQFQKSSKKELIDYVSRNYRNTITYDGRVLSAVVKDGSELLNLPPDYYSDDPLFKITNQSLSRCGAATQVIMLNEYLLQMPSDWWHPFYSRSSFYFHRRNAVNEFLNELINCHHS